MSSSRAPGTLASNTFDLARALLLGVALSAAVGLFAVMGVAMMQPASAAELAVERSADAADCRMEARYVDARGQLRADEWAMAQCMQRRGWDVEVPAAR